MLLLASTTDKLQVVTSGASSIDVRADWVDFSSPSTVTPGRTNTATISTATTTDIVASPASSVVRNIKGVSIRNRHATVTSDVTVKHTDGTNALEIIKVTALAPGESLIFNEGVGWVTTDLNGSVQTFISSAQTPPINYASVALIASPAGGQLEYDGKVPYFTPVSLERGVLDAEQFIRLTSTFTLVSQTAAQKLFNSPANGAVTVGANRTYQFECVFDLTTLSATSGGFGFAFAGTATLTRQKWLATANKAVLATQLAWQTSLNTAANVAICAASTATVGAAYIRGILTVGAGGTIIPQVSQATASAAIVQADSYFRIWAVGADTVQSVGNWS